MKFRSLRAQQAGLTVIELIVVMTLTLIFSGMVISFALDYWGASTSLQNDSETFVTRQNLGDILRDRLNSAANLINQNGIPDANTHVSDPADPSGSYWTPIHAVPRDIVLPAIGQFAPVLYYNGPSVTTSKTQIMNGTQPYYDEFILYLDGSQKTLMLRNLANPGASGNRYRTTCPASAATSTCPKDRIVATDVTSVSLRYFSRSGNVIDWTSIIDPITGAYIGPDYPSVEVVELTINLGREAIINGAQDTSNQTIVRVALRNG